MKGKLGSLHKGKLQIGGILNWDLDLLLTDYSHDNAIFYKLSKWKLTADSYWLFDIPSEIVIRLYPDSGKGYWEGIGHITLPIQKIFDTLIHSPIEIIGEGILEGKE